MVIPPIRRHACDADANKGTVTNQRKTKRLAFCLPWEVLCWRVAVSVLICVCVCVVITVFYLSRSHSVACALLLFSFVCMQWCTGTRRLSLSRYSLIYHWRVSLCAHARRDGERVTPPSSPVFERCISLTYIQPHFYEDVRSHALPLFHQNKGKACKTFRFCMRMFAWWWWGARSRCDMREDRRAGAVV